MNRKHFKASALLSLIVAAAPLAAQGASTQLAGSVADKSGAPLAGAVVTIRNAENGFTRTLSTDRSGRFVAANLPVGPYQVTATKDGYQTVSNVKVQLDLGDAAPLNIRMVSTATATVEVVAQTAAVDADRASAATLISPTALTDLPLLKRSFTDLATLTPQVAVSSRGNLAIAGQRGINTSINIDGTDYNDPFFGGTQGASETSNPFTISIEAVREFQVVTDGASAEFGRMGGGYLNAVTKSGTNDFSGSVFFYAEPKSLVANDFRTGQPAVDFKQQQFGFSAGGPIVKDKLFYFVAYDGQRANSPSGFQLGGLNTVAGFPLDPTKPGQANDAALLARGATYSVPANADTGFLRLDWNASENHAFQFRTNWSQFSGLVNTASLSSNFLNTLDNTSSNKVNTLTFVAQWNWTISSNLLNELSVNYSKQDLPRVPASTLPQVSITNVASYGGYTFARQFNTKRDQVSDTLTYVTPTVEIKGGFDYNRTSVSEIFAQTANGAYTFPDLASFRAGKWSSYTQRFGLGGLSVNDSGTLDTAEKEYAAFVQADWHVADNFKLGLGLRWDRQEHPDFLIPNFQQLDSNGLAPLTQGIPSDSEFSPRLSFTWTPDGDDNRTVVRGSVGRYVSRTPSVFLYQVYTVNGVRSASIRFNPPSNPNSTSNANGIPYGTAFDANDPFAFASLPSGASVPKGNIFSFSPDFKNPVTNRTNLGVERAYGAWVLGAQGTYAHTTRLERIEDVNLGTPTMSAQGRLVFPTTRPNANYAQMMDYVSDAEARYTAFTVSAKYHKDDSPFEAQFFYTYSHDWDQDSNERNFSSYSEQNTQNLDGDWGPADTDRTHVFTGYFSYLERQLTGINFGFNLRYLSGTPYSVTNSSDLNRDGVFGNDREIGTSRNGFRTADRTIVDLRMSRDWHFGQKMVLTGSLDFLNLFNHADWYSIQQFGGTDLLPKITYLHTTDSAPRAVQFGIRFAF